MSIIFQEQAHSEKWRHSGFTPKNSTAKHRWRFRISCFQKSDILVFPLSEKATGRKKKVSLKAFITLGVEGIYTQTSPPKQEGGLQQFDMVLAPMHVTEGL